MSEKKRSPQIFTWLLWLILVIGVSTLAAYGISRTFRKAQTPVTLNTALNLRNAIRSYELEYGKLPVFDSTFDTDLQTEHQLIDILLAADHTRRGNATNSRGIQFFYEKEAIKSEGGTFRKGIQSLPGGRGELWDPWGNYYYVRLDTNRDGEVADPTGRADSIKETVLVWSAGPDGDFDTWDDNPRTW